MRQPSVADIFPFEEPSAEQERLLSDIIRDYHKYDVFLINAPVAFGKSPCAKAIMALTEWHGGTANWIVPNNALVAQGRDEFGLPTLLRKQQYPDKQAFAVAKETMAEAPQAVMNYYTLLANKLYKNTLIVDEAHSLLHTLQDMEGVKYWEGEQGFPETLHNFSAVMLWLAERAQWDDKAAKTLKAIDKHPNMYTIAYEWGMLRGKHKQCLRVYPLSPKHNAPILWPPSKTKKIFLMSATTSPNDVEELGLSDRRVKKYEAQSGIPPERRPAIIHTIGNMSRGGMKEHFPSLVSFLYNMLETKKGKGFIHATYGLAAKLRAELSGHPRIMFHSKSNKGDQFKKWLKSEDGVFVGSGMTEGINLKGKLAEWQVIAKVPFPSLGDPAIRAKRDLDEEWYVWQAVRDILQAYGRVCRSPNDYGETYIVDSAFVQLYQKYPHLFPQWMKEAIC